MLRLKASATRPGHRGLLYTQAFPPRAQFLISKAQQDRSLACLFLFQNNPSIPRLCEGLLCPRSCTGTGGVSDMAVTMTAAWTGLPPLSALLGLLNTCVWCWRCWRRPWNTASAEQHLTESRPTDHAGAMSSGMHSIPTLEQTRQCC